MTELLIEIIKALPADVIAVTCLAGFVIYLLFRFIAKFLNTLKEMSDVISESKGVFESLVPLIRDRLR